MCKSWNAQTSVLCRHCWDAQWCVSITLDKCALEGGYIDWTYVQKPFALHWFLFSKNYVRPTATNWEEEIYQLKYILTLTVGAVYTRNMHYSALMHCFVQDVMSTFKSNRIVPNFSKHFPMLNVYNCNHCQSQFVTIPPLRPAIWGDIWKQERTFQ